jgi:hypothetical protein
LCAESQLSYYSIVVVNFTFLALYRHTSDTMLPHNSVNPPRFFDLIVPALQIECHVPDTMAIQNSKIGMRYATDSTDTTFSNVFDNDSQSVQTLHQQILCYYELMKSLPNMILMDSHRRTSVNRNGFPPKKPSSSEGILFDSASANSQITMISTVYFSNGSRATHTPNTSKIQTVMRPPMMKWSLNPILPTFNLQSI